MVCAALSIISCFYVISIWNCFHLEAAKRNVKQKTGKKRAFKYITPAFVRSAVFFFEWGISLLITL